ncbi:MAG: LysR family transcriptional regulator [Elainella sp. C42_A2020_010]|nr:LysR family transcriptional regulator [Elainella sp. C42_A2020_010]
MTLEQLRIFLAVVEHLHFTRAAEELYITQPAVSAAIQSLEKEYSLKLFHRVGRRVEITDAGKLLRTEAQKILDQVELTKRGLQELTSLQRGELRIGSSLTIGNYWLPERISEFKQQYPGITVNCILANAEEICEGTASGLFDLGLVTGEVKLALRHCLEQQAVDSDRLQIIVGKAHPWYQQGAVRLTDLLQTAWVMREPGSGTQQMFEQALQNWGINSAELNVVLVLNTSEMIKAVVENGVGAAAISEMMIQKELQLATLRAIQVVDERDGAAIPLEITQSVLLLKHRQRFQTRLALAFQDMLMAKVEKVEQS